MKRFFRHFGTLPLFHLSAPPLSSSAHRRVAHSKLLSYPQHVPQLPPGWSKISSRVYLGENSWFLLAQTDIYRIGSSVLTTDFVQTRSTNFLWLQRPTMKKFVPFHRQPLVMLFTYHLWVLELKFSSNCSYPLVNS